MRAKGHGSRKYQQVDAEHAAHQATSCQVGCFFSVPVSPIKRVLFKPALALNCFADLALHVKWYLLVRDPVYVKPIHKEFVASDADLKFKKNCFACETSRSRSRSHNKRSEHVLCCASRAEQTRTNKFIRDPSNLLLVGCTQLLATILFAMNSKRLSTSFS